MQPVQNQHIQNFVKLVGKLEEHNERHGLVAQVRSEPAAAIRSALGEEEMRGIPQEIPNPAQEAEAIFKQFSRTVFAMGLELVQNRAESEVAQLKQKYGMEQPSARAFKTDTLSFEVADSQTLVRFFQSITLRDLEGEGVKSAVAFLAKALDEGFVHEYMRQYLDPAVETWKGLQDPLLEVVSELNRLHLKEASARVALHVEQAMDGALKEYLIAESQNILVDTGVYNARRWHIDTTPERYKKNWDEAVEAARQISDNPKAAKIFDRVHRFLTESAEFAEREVGGYIVNPPPEYSAEYWRGGGPSKLETVRAVLRELAMLRPEQDE